MLAVIASLLLSAAPPPPAVAPPSEQPVATAPVALNPAKMSQAAIKAHNAEISPHDPQYIRCKRSVPIGSLIASTFRCRTNAQWTAAEVAANDEARAIREKVSSKSLSTGGM